MRRHGVSMPGRASRALVTIGLKGRGVAQRIATKRLLHAYCLGLPKCGTHSVADVFAPPFRSAHEPDAVELLGWLTRLRSGDASQSAFDTWLVDRDERNRLDMEASHYLAECAPALVRLFPRARFVLVVRPCRTWLNSITDDQLNSRQKYWAAAWTALGYNPFDHYFGPSGSFAPEEVSLEANGLFPLAHYLDYWRSRIEAVCEAVPPDRLLVVPTDQLTESLGRIAEFVGAPMHLLASDRSHAYRSPKRHGIIDEIDAGFVNEVIEARCGPVQRRLLGVGSTGS